MPAYGRTALACPVVAVLLLAGCASHPQRTSPTGAPTATSHSAPLIPRSAPEPATSGQAPPAPNGMVGIASCDQYLSTYKACHRAAGIFAPDQIDARYELMHDSLLRDARDPAKRATLDQRCRALSTQLQQALHGKSCNALPAPVASSGKP